MRKGNTKVRLKNSHRANITCKRLSPIAPPSVLIFSSSVKLLKMLEDYIQRDREYRQTSSVDGSEPAPIDNCEMLHGGVKDEDRVAAVDRFQRPDSNVFVFLISKSFRFCQEVLTLDARVGTLAGGVGLNLTAVSQIAVPTAPEALYPFTRPTRSSSSIPTGVCAAPGFSEPLMYNILIESETLDPAHDLQAMDRYVTRPQAVMAGELILHHSQSIPDGTEKRRVSYKASTCLTVLTRCSQRCLPAHISRHHRRKHIRASSPQVVCDEDNVGTAPYIELHSHPFPVVDQLRRCSGLEAV